jgi:hypothetical protein
MAAPSVRLVRSAKKHRRHSENNLMRRNTDKARTSAIVPTVFCHQRTSSTTSAMQESNLRAPTDESLELANGKLLRRRKDRCLWHHTKHGDGGSSEPPCHALDGLLRSTPPQIAALGAIVAVIIIAVAILSLCSSSLIRAPRGVRVGV